ncbi:MAG: polymerase [Bifidobacterium sp.]|nr:polymerase [Bifidobacterium sp.]
MKHVLSAGNRSADVRDVIMDYGLILAVIYNSNSMWALVPDQFKLSCHVLGIVALAYYMIIVVVGKSSQWLERSLKPMGIIMVATIAGQCILALVHGDHSYRDSLWFQYAIILPLLVGCFLMCGRRYVLERFLPRLVRLAALFAGVSTILWFLSSFCHVPPFNMERLEWTSGNKVGSYLGLYYNVQDMSWHGGKIWRNSSIFNEPPCAAAFFGIVLAADRYLIPGKRTVGRNWCAMALAAALVSSCSTGGILYLLMIYVPWLGRLAYHRLLPHGRRTSIGVLVSVGLAGVLVGIFVVMGKVTGSYSGQTHWRDLTEGMRIWAERPLAGFGFASDKYVWQHYLSHYRKGMGYTSGLVFMLARGGLVLAIYALVPWMCLAVCRRNWEQTYFALIIMVMFLTVPVQNFALLLVVYAYGYCCLWWRRHRGHQSASMASIDESPYTKETLA